MDESRHVFRTKKGYRWFICIGMAMVAILFAISLIVSDDPITADGVFFADRYRCCMLRHWMVVLEYENRCNP
jgi:hypothetical protein